MVIYLSPRGKVLDNEIARDLAQNESLNIFVCGHYEGSGPRDLSTEGGYGIIHW